MPRAQRKILVTAAALAVLSIGSVSMAQSKPQTLDLDAAITQLHDGATFFNGKLPQEKEIDALLAQLSKSAEANSLRLGALKTLKPNRPSDYIELPVQM